MVWYDDAAMRIDTEVEVPEDLMPFDEFGRKFRDVVLQTRQSLYKAGHRTGVEIHLSENLWTVLVDKWPDYYLWTGWDWERGQLKLSPDIRTKMVDSLRARMIKDRKILVYGRWYPVVLDVASLEDGETIWVVGETM